MLALHRYAAERRARPPGAPRRARRPAARPAPAPICCSTTWPRQRNERRQRLRIRLRQEGRLAGLDHRRARQGGNGVELRNLATGDRCIRWTARRPSTKPHLDRKGRRARTALGVEDKGFEDKVYSVVAFKGSCNSASTDQDHVRSRRDKSFPAGMSIGPDRTAAWRDDLSAVTFGIHEVKPKRRRRPRRRRRADGDESRGTAQRHRDRRMT